CHTTIRIVDIAKHNRLRWASGLTRCDNFSIANLSIFFFCGNARSIDALHTIGAFFHDTATADTDVGIALHLNRRGIPILEEVEVETSDFVWAIIRAIPCTHTTVVHHVIQPFFTMNCRTDWADRFTRGIFTLHTRHRLVDSFWIVKLAGVVAVNANPVHLASDPDLLLADHWNVVLGLAGNGAGIATDAGTEIYSHSPGAPIILHRRIERHLGLRVLAHLFDEVGLVMKLADRTDANEVAPIHS